MNGQGRKKNTVFSNFPIQGKTDHVPVFPSLGKHDFPKFPAGKEKPTTSPVFPQIGKNSTLRVAEKFPQTREKPPISKEIVGEGVSKQHLPPSLHRDSPTQFPYPADAISFVIDWNGRNPPTVTAQEKKIAVGRDGKPRLYDPPALAKARADFCARLERFAPDAPFEGPVELKVQWIYGRRDGRTGWKDTRPDMDNLQKLLKDCMTRTRFWLDDAQVAKECVSKFWSTSLPRIRISITPLGNED